jgi:hypothetical protein
MSAFEVRHIADVQRGETAQFPVLYIGGIAWSEPLTVRKVSQPHRHSADWLIEYADGQHLITREAAAFHGARVITPGGAR